MKQFQVLGIKGHFGASDASFRDQLASFRISFSENRKCSRRARFCLGRLKYAVPLNLVAEQEGKLVANAHICIRHLSHLIVSQEVPKLAMAPTQAEVKLVELKNCFVNVPLSIVAQLDNANAVSSQIALFGHLTHYC